MSKVGIPPPHDSEKPHALVAGINNINNNKELLISVREADLHS